MTHRRRNQPCAIFASIVALLAVAACNRPKDAPPDMGKWGQAALSNPRFSWDSVRTAGLTSYHPRGNDYLATRAAQYHEESKEAIARALSILGEPAFPDHLQVFVMGSREDVEAVAGIGWGGWADPAGRNAAVVARPECQAVFRHEIMHVVSMVLWGNPLGPDRDPFPTKDSALMAQGYWLREGLAAFAEDRYFRYSYRGMAAQWLAEDAIIPLETLVHRFWSVDDLAAYLQSGSLVNYLISQYGRERFRQVWRYGAGAIERVYGKPQTQIVSEWHAWLRATPASERPTSIAQALSEDRCPRRRK